jgi:potassium efflux system protein
VISYAAPDGPGPVHPHEACSMRQLLVPRRFRLGLPVLGALGLVLAAPHLAAQEAPAPAPPAEAPKEPEPRSISMPDVASQAQSLEAGLASLEKQLSAAGVLDELKQALPSREKAIQDKQAELDEALAAASSLDAMESVELQWRALAKELTTLDSRVDARVAELSKTMAELEELASVWSLTESAARQQKAPPELRKQISNAKDLVASSRRSFQTHSNEALELESRLGALQAQVDANRQRIVEYRGQVLGQILARDSLPLWRAEFRKTLPAADGAIRQAYVQPAAEIFGYVNRHPDPLVLQVMLTLLLLWGTRRVHTRVDRLAAEETRGPGPDEGAARSLLSHPLAASLVLGLASGLFLHPGAPRSFLRLLALLLLPPLIVIVRSIMPSSLRALLYGLAALYLSERIRELLGAFELVSRLLFLLEMGATAIGIAWLQRSKRLSEIPRELAASLWIRPLAAWMRLALAAVSIAFLGGVFGYMQLADLVGRSVLAASYLALVLLTAVWISDELIHLSVRSRLLRRLRTVRSDPEGLERPLRLLLRIGAVGAWLYFVLGFLAVRDPVFAAVSGVLSAPIGYGALSISLGGVLAFALTLWISWLLARIIDTTLNQEVYPRISLPRGVPFALSSLTRYTILVLGFLAAVAALGFDLDRLTLVASAFGVGIGFGLQNVVNNFVSGLILLFERPVQVGDRVEMTGVSGDIKRIGIRASVVRTFDGADVIVPNGSFISDVVTNWTLADRLRRITLPVGVAYGTDPERVIELLLEVARRHDLVLADPEPRAFFLAFGESSLDFEVRVWTSEYDSRLQIQSDLAVAVNRALAENGIEIPFPQRDLHVRSVNPGSGLALSGRSRPEPDPGGDPV